MPRLPRPGPCWCCGNWEGWEGPGLRTGGGAAAPGGEVRRLNIRLQTSHPPERVKGILAGMTDVARVTIPDGAKEKGARPPSAKRTSSHGAGAHRPARPLHQSHRRADHQPLHAAGRRSAAERWRGSRGRAGPAHPAAHRPAPPCPAGADDAAGEHHRAAAAHWCATWPARPARRSPCAWKARRWNSTGPSSRSWPTPWCTWSAMPSTTASSTEGEVRCSGLAGEGPGAARGRRRRPGAWTRRPIRRKRLEKGLLTPAQAQALRDRDVLQMVCYPGFSTAAQGDRDLRPRGRHGRRQVGGGEPRRHPGDRLSPGRGTRFLLKLPLSVAIIQVLLVECAGHTLGIPITRVWRTLEVGREEVRASGRQMVVRLPKRVEKTDAEEPRR